MQRTMKLAAGGILAGGAALLAALAAESSKELPAAEKAGAAQSLPAGGDTGRSDVNPGTQGRNLLVPPMRAGVRVAILGALFPADEAGIGRLVAEINAQQPDIVLTTGDLVRGFAEDAEQYAVDARKIRERLNALSVPWYPCVGPREISSAARDEGDAPAAALYSRYFGPRYYSVDLGDTHLIVLDSQENPAAAPALSDAQVMWLAKDLDKAFRRARHVAVVMHRALWREENSNWDRVQRLLVAFNQRPVVAIEGEPNSSGRGGRVEAVIAAADGYCQDAPRDGIRMITVGPALGAGQTATGRMSQYLMLRLGGIAGSPAPLVNVVEAGHLFAGDHVTAEVREAIEKLESPGAIAVEGFLPEPHFRESGSVIAGESPIWLTLANPLKDRWVRIKPALAAGSTGWDLVVPFPSRQTLPDGTRAEDRFELAPGEKKRVRVGLYSAARASHAAPPEIVFKIAVGEREFEIARRVPLAPSATLRVQEKYSDEAMRNAEYGALWSYDTRDAAEPNHFFHLLADKSRIYFRVPFSRTKLSGEALASDRPWEFAEDCVVLEWEKDGQVHCRVIPAQRPGPGTLKVWAGAGIGAAPSKLKLMDDKARDVAFGEYQERQAGAVIATPVLSLPRNLIEDAKGEARINVRFIQGARGERKKAWEWASHDAGPQAWGTVKFQGNAEAEK